MDVKQLVEIARAKEVVITTAESCTGGLVAAAITDTPGSSAMFDRGFVTYSNAAKAEMLGVEQATLDAYGAVSEEVAAQMARGAIQHSRATLSVSITGIAGPGGSEFKPEGRVCFGVATANNVTTQTVEFGALGREQVRLKAREYALDLLLSATDSV
ncbi:CinA family protein [Loktanella sp. S4079]|uniref:CinA family protein n=1 Tax=Loktanella sp. S4079 TaxID=579483 RepID=UPI0005FA545E|nr:CinA family protein [Loktanella sp. S4079]KJZ20122.1 damage-inducible protein CinA [Loktanella sp. S4079]